MNPMSMFNMDLLSRILTVAHTPALEACRQLARAQALFVAALHWWTSRAHVFVGSLRNSKPKVSAKPKGTGSYIRALVGDPQWNPSCAL